MDSKQQLNYYLTATVSQNASDLHLAVGRKPTLRIDGALVPIQDTQLLTVETIEGMINELLRSDQKERLAQDKTIDFSHSFDNTARFRVNAYYQRGTMAAAFRFVPAKIKTLEELNLPPVLRDFTGISQGFVLVVGPAGHGKSTTLAA